MISYVILDCRGYLFRGVSSNTICSYFNFMPKTYFAVFVQMPDKRNVLCLGLSAIFFGKVGHIFFGIARHIFCNLELIFRLLKVARME